MEETKMFVSGLTVLFAMLSAFAWLKTSVAKVPAKNPEQIGGLLGGDINVKDERGVTLDFHATFALQSKWNSLAACFSALAALSAAITFLLDRP